MPGKKNLIRFRDRLLALNLLELIVQEISNEQPICVDPDPHTEALRCGVLTLRDFIYEDAEDCWLQRQQLDDAVGNEYCLINEDILSWGAALGVGFYEVDYEC